MPGHDFWEIYGPKTDYDTVTNPGSITFNAGAQANCAQAINSIAEISLLVNGKFDIGLRFQVATPKGFMPLPVTIKLSQV